MGEPMGKSGLRWRGAFCDLALPEKTPGLTEISAFRFGTEAAPAPRGILKPTPVPRPLPLPTPPPPPRPLPLPRPRLGGLPRGIENALDAFLISNMTMSSSKDMAASSSLILQATDCDRPSMPREEDGDIFISVTILGTALFVVFVVVVAIAGVAVFVVVVVLVPGIGLPPSFLKKTAGGQLSATLTARFKFDVAAASRFDAANPTRRRRNIPSSSSSSFSLPLPPPTM